MLGVKTLSMKPLRSSPFIRHTAITFSIQTCDYTTPLNTRTQNCISQVTGSREMHQMWAHCPNGKQSVLLCSVEVTFEPLRAALVSIRK